MSDLAHKVFGLLLLVAVFAILVVLFVILSIRVSVLTWELIWSAEPVVQQALACLRS